MPKAASSNSNQGPSFQAPRHRPHWVTAITCGLIGMLIVVALVDYSPLQSRTFTTHPTEENAVGWVGVKLGEFSLSLFGGACWIIPVALFWIAFLAIKNGRALSGSRIGAIVVFLIAGAGLGDMLSGFFSSVVGGFEPNRFVNGFGGWVGTLVYTDSLAAFLGRFGSAVVLGLVYVLSIIFICTSDIGAELDKAFQAFQDWRAQRRELRAEEERMRAELRAAEEKRKVEASKPLVAAPAPPVAKKLEITRDPNRPPSRSPFAKPADPASETPKASVAAIAVADKPPAQLSQSVSPSSTPSRSPFGEAKIVRGGANATPASPVAKSDLAAGAPPLAAGGPIAIVKAEEPKKAKAASVVPAAEPDYQYPPLVLLKEQVKPSAEDSDQEHLRNMEDLVRILGEFGVTVTPGEIHVGPVITCYEVVPAPGVRVEKIAGLDKNIALGMRAQSVRILAPIPGKAAVGVEIPNRHPTPVGMREILESEDWVGAKAEIPIALGKDVSGKPLISDLAKMPHLLIAGATGSGKSVCINSIIASIVYRKSPKDLRLLMVDPKVVELKVFNTLPHMLIPVVTEPKKVPSALKWLLGEMEQRYQIFAKVGVRNIAGYNSRKKPAAGAGPTSIVPAETPDQPTLEGVVPAASAEELAALPPRLPYIVAIIDELADLMMVAPAEIETSIARLAQLARAAGIHLIIATQRPSVNVITGVIKANLPSRIAFQVASQVDSRTILDGKGADTLIGRGDMLFSPPGSSRLVRAQGAFVSDEEVAEFVEFLKRNGPPKYAENVQNQIDDDAASNADNDEEEETDGEGADDEKLYQKAMGVLRATKRASTSTLQRRLRIGYNRAARIMDLMEERGVVGPENGSSPREILIDLDRS